LAISSDEPILIEDTGIHDHRKRKEKTWSDVDSIDSRCLLSGGIITLAQLEVKTNSEPTIAVDISRLDQNHKAILKAAKKT
jgi:hypothetical protein